MSSEILQFLGFLALTGVAIVLWLFIIFIPGRTMENWSGGKGPGGPGEGSAEVRTEPVSPESRDTGR